MEQRTAPLVILFLNNPALDRGLSSIEQPLFSLYKMLIWRLYVDKTGHSRMTWNREKYLNCIHPLPLFTCVFVF